MEWGNVEELLLKTILVGGPIASLLYAIFCTHNKTDFSFAILVGAAVSLGAWARLKWWLG